MPYYVYKTTNIKTNKIYIGVHHSVDIDNDQYLGSGSLLRKSIKKHGKDSFSREVLAEFDDGDLAYKLEEELVTEEFLLTNTYNLCLGGKGSRPCNASRFKGAAKTAEIIRGRTKENHLGRKAQAEKLLGELNPSKRLEVRDKISKSNKGSNNAMFGKYGENHPRSKLSNEQRKELIDLFESNKYSRRELSKIFNVSYDLVKKIIQTNTKLKEMYYDSTCTS